MGIQLNESVAARHALIALHHVELSRRQQQVLYLKCQGFEDDEIGSLLGCKLNTIRNHLTAARLRVVPANLPPTSVEAVDWAWMHLDCCLVSAVLTLNRQFTGGLPSRTGS